MEEKKKKIIYFILIALLALAFIVLYLLDNNIEKSEKGDAFSIVYDSIGKSVSNETNKNETDNSADNNFTNKTLVDVINWETSKMDSIQVFSQRKDYTLIRFAEKKWMIKSARLEEKISPANNALFRLLNIFSNMRAGESLIKDYSAFSQFFEDPICTVVVHFKDKSQQRLNFIRIAQIHSETGETELKTWVRVNEETVVYASSYNTLQRFLVAEKEFLKFY